MINVTKTFLPPFDEYTSILKRAWDKTWITNNGELVLELEEKLKAYLGVKHLFFCNNGTIVLQMALKAFGITKEVITTPYSYVATTNAILWENCKPVFVDIDEKSLCIEPEKIEAAITADTEAILATHVYGLHCDIEKIQAIAQKHSLKVIYDGAHAFGSIYNNNSLLSYGDISTCSFHATKLFHTVEGGCIITNDDSVAEKLMLYRQFGHVYDNYQTIGINAKNSEFHAAMGLAVFNHFEDILDSRKLQWNLYYEKLGSNLKWNKEMFVYNYSYFPVFFTSEGALLKCMDELKQKNILPRRYFYPSLNNLPYLKEAPCLISENKASKVLCLPLYYDLGTDIINSITTIVHPYIK